MPSRVVVLALLAGCGPAEFIEPGPQDAGLDAGAVSMDAGVPVVDAGPPDAGPPDAGPPDAGGDDAGAVDAGDPCEVAPDASFTPRLVVLVDGGLVTGAPGEWYYTHQRLDLRAEGLPPCREVELRFTLDAGHQSWGRFRASAQGDVRTARDAPLAGTWTDVDVDGPLWSQSLGVTAPPSVFNLHVVLRWDGGAPVTAFVPRTPTPPGMTVTEFREVDGGVYADLLKPPGPGPFPAVLAWGGSDCGLGGGRTVSQTLVAEGFAVMVVGYCFVPGRGGLDRVPLEVFRRALARLKAQPDVRGDRVAMLGVSRGGEAVLALAAAFPGDFSGAVAFHPSGFAWAAPGSSTRSTWTLDGGDVPFLPWPTGPGRSIARDAGYTVSFGDTFFLRGLQTAEDAGLAARAQFRVEAFQGPFLLVAAGDDGVWPSCPLTDPIWGRLVDAGHAAAHGDRYTCFPGIGHSVTTGRVGFPLVDLIDRGSGNSRSGYGGTAKADNDANQVVRREVVEFMRAVTR